jgi:hypothetical protein
MNTVVRELLPSQYLPIYAKCTLCDKLIHTPWECTFCGLLCSSCRPDYCWDKHDAIVRADLHTLIQNSYHDFHSDCFLCGVKGTYDEVLKHFDENHPCTCFCGVTFSCEEWIAHKKYCPELYRQRGKLHSNAEPIKNKPKRGLKGTDAALETFKTVL